jgi:hypothetical protein
MPFGRHPTRGDPSLMLRRPSNICYDSISVELPQDVRMPLSSLPSPTTVPRRAPRAQARRVKRGIVAGYIHDISPRHRDDQPARPASTFVTAPLMPPGR